MLGVVGPLVLGVLHQRIPACGVSSTLSSSCHTCTVCWIGVTSITQRYVQIFVNICVFVCVGNLVFGASEHLLCAKVAVCICRLKEVWAAIFFSFTGNHLANWNVDVTFAERLHVVFYT